MSNKKIKKNLVRLASKNLEIIRKTKIEHIYTEIIEDFNGAVFIDTSKELISSYIDQTNITINKCRNDNYFQSLIEEIKNETLHNEESVLDFDNQLIEIFNLTELDIKSQTQIIFFEYDSNPEIYIYGYGKGDYKLVLKPSYFDFNFNDDSFEAKTFLNFSKVWKNYMELERLLNELDFDSFYDTRFYKSISEFYKYKVFYLLHLSFEKNSDLLFKNLSSENPIYLYGKEHDCEPISIYIYGKTNVFKRFFSTKI